MIIMWKWISGYEGLYQISNIGLVRSLNRFVSHGQHNQLLLRGRILKPAVAKGGHFRVGLNKDGKQKTHLVHRLVLETFAGPCPEGMECRHLDGNPANNHIDNLAWGTAQENSDDRVVHGTDLKGEKCNWAKLTNKMALEIRILYSTNNYTQQELSKLYNVGQATISDVINCKFWNYVA